MNKINIWHDAKEKPKEGLTIVVCMNDESLIVLTSWGENGDFCVRSEFWYNIHKQKCWAYKDDLLKLAKVPDEPTSEDLEEASRNYTDNEEYGDDVYYSIKAAFKAGANWQLNKIGKEAVDATIGLPYENKDGGYTHLIDVSRLLPVGDNKIIIIKE